MDDISGLLGAVIVIVSVIIANVKKNSAKAAGKEKGKTSGSGQKRKSAYAPGTKPKAAAPVSPAPPAEIREIHDSGEGIDPCHDEMLKVSPKDDQFWKGSLGAVSEEGVDPCHEEQLSETVTDPRISTAETYEPRLNPANLAQAFVLQEILKRPAERKLNR